MKVQRCYTIKIKADINDCKSKEMIVHLQRKRYAAKHSSFIVHFCLKMGRRYSYRDLLRYNLQERGLVSNYNPRVGSKIFQNKCNAITDYRFS